MSETKHMHALRLRAFLPYRLSVLSNTISKQIAALYQSQFGLSIWQWRVMAVLGEAAGLDATEIVTRTAMDKVAVSRAVTGLIELGHVRREAVQHDGRRSLLFLTKKGQQTYSKIARIAQSEEKAMTDVLTKAEAEELNQLLEKLADVVSPDRALW